MGWVPGTGDSGGNGTFGGRRRHELQRYGARFTVSAIARRRLAYPAFFALALAACSGRRGTGADSAPPPDGDLDVPVPEPADAPAVVESAGQQVAPGILCIRLA